MLSHQKRDESRFQRNSACSRQALGSFPSPLWGGVGVGVVVVEMMRSPTATPLPTLPHKGGGSDRA